MYLQEERKKERNFKQLRRRRRRSTINFLPVMVEGEDSRENVVREWHGLRGSLEHHANKFFHVSNEETIRGSSDSLLGEMAFNPSRSPPEQHCNPEHEEHEHERERKKLKPGQELLHVCC